MFFTYSQNNSGGHFTGPALYVIIEAPCHTEANRRAEQFIYFNGTDEDGPDCPCCGDRWHEFWKGDGGDEVPSLYGEPVDLAVKEDKYRYRDWATEASIPMARIYYLDGREVDVP